VWNEILLGYYYTHTQGEKQRTLSSDDGWLVVVFGAVSATTDVEEQSLHVHSSLTTSTYHLLPTFYARETSFLIFFHPGHREVFILWEMKVLRLLWEVRNLEVF
jgi:hypothetical protein